MAHLHLTTLYQPLTIALISHTRTLTPPPGVKSGGVVGGAKSPAGLRRPPAEGASVECEAGRGGRSVGVGGMG